MFTVSGKDVCSAHALLVERSVKCGEVFVKVLVEDSKGERITIQIPEDDLSKDIIDKLFSFKYSQIFPKDLSTILDEDECDLLLNFPGGSIQTKNGKKGFVMIDKIVIDDSGEAHTYYVEPYGMIQFGKLEVRGELHLSLTSHSCLATNKQILFEDEIKQIKMFSKVLRCETVSLALYSYMHLILKKCISLNILRKRQVCGKRTINRTWLIIRISLNVGGSERRTFLLLTN